MTIQCLSNPSQYVPICLEQFPSYSNRKFKKIAVFTYRSPHFCFSWKRPCDYHAICCMGGKTIQCLPNPSYSMYLSMFNSFRVIWCLSQCVSPKIAIFSTFLFPLGTRLGQSRTLNVVWMEREFDAYKLSRCMSPSNYNRFWDTARYLWKNRHFIILPAFDAPVRGVPVGISVPPLGWKNLNGVATRWWKNFADIFILFDVIHARDGQMDKQHIPRLCIRIAR